jgi:hypothetical protein
VDREGNEVVIDKGTVPNVAEGDYATIIAKRMPKAPPRAMSYRNLEQLVERLQSHLENAQSQEAFERLSALLDEAHSKHIAALEKVKHRLKEKAPEESKAIAHIDEAISRSEERYQAAHARADEMRVQLQQWLSQWQTVKGIVSSVNTAARTVDIGLEGGESITVQISPLTLIMKDGRHAFLRDVAEGDVVEKLVYSTETLKATKLLLASPVTGEGTVEVRVTDAPPAYNVTSIMVAVDKVEIHKAGGDGEKGEWIPLDIVNPTFDLKELQKEDLEEILAAGNVTAGKYTQIRMTIEKVEVALEKDEPQETILPSNELKFVRPFDVVDGGTTILTLDFDANKSLVAGAGKVIVKPVVRLAITPHQYQFYQWK